MVSRGDSTPTFAVVLAGGIGSRFWPASTPDRPKQLLPLGGDAPLIVETVRRAERLVGPEYVRLLTGRDLVTPFRRVLPDYPEERFWVEPEARNTGPVLTWAATRIEREAPGAIMISLHADHLISPFEEFAKTIERAKRAAYERGSLVCLGITPTRAETGYGYVETGATVGDGVHAVSRFIEKPGLEAARTYMRSGRHLWNTGIFVWRAADFLLAIERWCEEIAPALPALENDDIEAFFAGVRPVSVDIGVLERADNVETATATFAWDDLGTWEAIARTREADSSGNFKSGPVRVIDGSDNIVWSESGRVVLFGVEDLVVVTTDDETLVMRRDLAPQLNKLLERLKEDE